MIGDSNQYMENNELLPEVDICGNVIGCITRDEAHSGSHRLHPVVHLYVYNSKHQLFLQRRPTWKIIQPGKWDTVCGGHIEYGENLEDALRREVWEELGITDFTPMLIKQYVYESKVEREFINVFTTIYDGKICPNSNELDGGRFWTHDEIINNIGKGILTENFEKEYMMVLK